MSDPRVLTDMFGARAFSPRYGEVLVISAHPDDNGEVDAVRKENGNNAYGYASFRFPVKDLYWEVIDSE